MMHLTHRSAVKPACRYPPTAGRANVAHPSCSFTEKGNKKSRPLGCALQSRPLGGRRRLAAKRREEEGERAQRLDKQAVRLFLGMKTYP